MKIRELFESINVDGNMHISIYYSSYIQNPTLAQGIKAKIRNDIKLVPATSIMGIVVHENYVNINIDGISPQEYSNRTKLDDIQNELAQIASKLVTQYDPKVQRTITNYGLTFRELPSAVVDCYAIILNLNKATSFSKCDKILGKGKTTIIYNPENITDSVLGLIKLKDVIIVDNNQLEWVKIFEKHKNGNIMDFQEELMDNGLEEYAQL